MHPDPDAHLRLLPDLGGQGRPGLRVGWREGTRGVRFAAATFQLARPELHDHDQYVHDSRSRDDCCTDDDHASTLDCAADDRSADDTASRPDDRRPLTSAEAA